MWRGCESLLFNPVREAAFQHAKEEWISARSKSTKKKVRRSPRVNSLSLVLCPVQGSGRVLKGEEVKRYAASLRSKKGLLFRARQNKIRKKLST